jgi:hypothetical protein
MKKMAHPLCIASASDMLCRSITVCDHIDDDFKCVKKLYIHRTEPFPLLYCYTGHAPINHSLW